MPMQNPKAYLTPATLTPVACFLYYFQRHISLSYLAAGVIVLGGFFLLYATWEKPFARRLAKTVFPVLAIALLALGLWQFLQLRDPGDIDHASYSCALWNMARGNPWYSINNMNFFGTHADYTGLLWIPIQALAGEWGLKAGKCLCMVFAAMLAVRRFRGNPDIAGWGAAALLLSPPLASQFFNGFHLEYLAAPILVLALDAFREKRLARFLLYAAFLAYSKEVFTLAIGGMLLVAVVERRSWKWILLPGLLCSAMMGLYWFVILRHFAPEGNNLESFMPHSLAEIMAMWFRRDTLFYFFHVGLPFLPLMLVLPKRYLLLPLPLMVFYAAFTSWIFESMTTHYNYPVAFLCFGGLILAANPPEVRLGRILMACAVTALLSYPIWRPNLSVPAPDFARVRDVHDIASQVPGDAAVLVSAPFMARFAARKDVSDWTYRKRPAETYDYILIDRGFTPEFHVEKDRLERDLDSLTHSPAWDVAFARDGLYLLRNKLSPVPPPRP